MIAAASMMMTTIFKAFVLLGVLTIAIVGCAPSSNTNITWPTEFVELEPFTDRDQLACAGNSDYSWNAEIIGSEIDITPHIYSREQPPDELATLIERVARKTIRIGENLPIWRDLHNVLRPNAVSAFLKLDGGWLVGFNLGEFGGGLWWFNNDAEGTKYRNQNVHEIFWDGEQIIVTTGLAHMGSDRGEILVFILDTTGIPQISQTLSSPSSVQRIVKTKSGFIAATFKGPIHITKNGRVTYDGTAAGRDRHLTYPNSIDIAPDGSIFIGARYAILKYKNAPEDFAPTWLVPRSCVHFIPDERKADCKCISE